MFYLQRCGVELTEDLAGDEIVAAIKTIGELVLVVAAVDGDAQEQTPPLDLAHDGALAVGFGVDGERVTVAADAQSVELRSGA